MTAVRGSLKVTSFGAKARARQKFARNPRQNPTCDAADAAPKKWDLFRRFRRADKRRHAREFRTCLNVGTTAPVQKSFGWGYS